MLKIGKEYIVKFPFGSKKKMVLTCIHDTQLPTEIKYTFLEGNTKLMFTHSACKKMIISDNTPEVKWDMWRKQYVNNIMNVNNMNNVNNNSKIINVHEYIYNTDIPLPPIRSTPVRGEGWEC